jgi:hypothetical protein
MSASRIAAWTDERTRISNYLSSAESLNSSVGADGVQATKADRAQLERRLSWLDTMIDRASGAAPMRVRGRLTGL